MCIFYILHPNCCVQSIYYGSKKGMRCVLGAVLKNNHSARGRFFFIAFMGPQKRNSNPFFVFGYIFDSSGIPLQRFGLRKPKKQTCRTLCDVACRIIALTQMQFASFLFFMPVSVGFFMDKPQQNCQKDKTYYTTHLTPARSTSRVSVLSSAFFFLGDGYSGTRNTVCGWWELSDCYNIVTSTKQVARPLPVLVNGTRESVGHNVKSRNDTVFEQASPSMQIDCGDGRARSNIWRKDRRQNRRRNE